MEEIHPGHWLWEFHQETLRMRERNEAMAKETEELREQNNSLKKYLDSIQRENK